MTAKKTVFNDNTTSFYSPEVIAQEVHDFFGKAIRTVDSRSVVGRYYTHFKAEYNADNNPSTVKYYRGSKSHITNIVTTDAATLGGKFFVIHSAPNNHRYVVWYNVDGLSTRPIISGAKYIEVAIQSTDTAVLVAMATTLVINGVYGSAFLAQRNHSSVSISTVGLGLVDSSVDGTTGFILSETLGEQELVSEITIIYSGTDPYFEGQLLRGYSYDIYEGKFVKNAADITFSGVTVDTYTASLPTIQNITIPLANTEYAIEFPVDTNKINLKVRDSAGKLQMSWTLGETSTNFITLGLGVTYSENDLKLKEGSRTLYVRATKPGLVIEVLSWV